MNTSCFGSGLKESHEARKSAQERRKRNAELREFFTGGSLVLAGLLLATIYGLLTHRLLI
jgi:hypothetical protein